MSAQNLTEEVKKRSAWSIFMGVLTAALGAFLIIYPLATATITTVLLGWALIFVGIAQFVFALYSQKVGNFFLKVLLGVLSVITGVALAFFPIEGVEVLTGLLGTLLLVQAGLATVAAFQVRPLEGWGWFLFDAAASLCMGILNSRQMALQFCLGHRHAGRCCCASRRYLQDRDCLEDAE